MKKVFLVVIIAFIHISTNGQIGIRTFDSGKISFAKKNSKNILNDINISENKFKVDIQKLPHFAISETNIKVLNPLYFGFQNGSYGLDRLTDTIIV